jgi:hypothetical protein
VALPPTHFFVGAAAGELSRTGGINRFHVWAVGGLVSILPDVPTAAMLFMGLDAPDHGLYSHSLLAVAFVTILAWASFGKPWGIVVGWAYSAHLLVDLMRVTEGTSVYLFGPWIAEPMNSIAPVFPTVRFDRVNGEIMLFGQDPIGDLLLQVGIGIMLFIGAIIVREGVSRARGGRTWGRRRHSGRRPRKHRGTPRGNPTKS